MLQPRLKMGSDSENFGKMGVRKNSVRMSRGFVWLCIAILYNSNLVLCQGINVNNDESIEATIIKRDSVPDNRDLTVLLVNDQKGPGDYNSKIGRYQSIKPLIGLLTSTARTFIQDGVTTEYATQILGTTLNNGRIYAQILTKSSLVLYNKPSNVDDSLVKPTRVHSAFDGQWSVKQDLGVIDPKVFVLKNTDYISPSSKMEIVYPSKYPETLKDWNDASIPDISSENNELTARRVQQFKEIPRYNNKNEAFNYLDGPSIESEKKHEFVLKPSILENVNILHRQSKAYQAASESVKVDSRFRDDTLNESNIVKVKPNLDLPTFTIKNEFSPIFYYIDNVESRSSVQQVLQPSKLAKKLFGQNNEPRAKKTYTYAGFADFTTVVGDAVIIFTPNTEISGSQQPNRVNVFPSAKRVDKLATKITFLSADIPVATSTFRPHEVKDATKIGNPIEDFRSQKALYNDDDSLKKVLYDVDNKVPDAINVQYNSGFDLNLDVIQPSEPAMISNEKTKLTDSLEVIPLQDYNMRPTDPLKTLNPSSTIIEIPKESAVTESDLSYTDSDEESMEDGEDTTEAKPETTTESDITTETESSEESDLNDEESPVVCTNGVETQSTMTTAYKTLTYLTTYFIPLESSKTTTSVKSNVVVESNFGYLTNIVCKIDSEIKPTSTVLDEVKPTIISSLEQHDEQEVTENNSFVTEKDSEIVTVKDIPPKNNESELTQGQKDVSVSPPVEQEPVLEKETSTTTTTEQTVTTSKSHVEVSVNTEDISEIVTTEKNDESGKNEEIDSKENEIDLIYKTLYTTYTYFTTFFGDKTSSVASHKSVFTNIITSSIDLSKMDPSILGAFNEDEIAPTSVGIGRPTESYSINSIIDLIKNKDVIESVEIGENYNTLTPTPSLGDDLVASIKPDAVKTYFTTYTFFTTIFVGNDANICSRSEVYTNYVGPDELIPTKSNPLAVESTKKQFDFRNCRQVKGAVSTTEAQQDILETSDKNVKVDVSAQNIDDTPSQPTPVEVDMLFSVESSPLESENTFVTDVKSSYSKGDKKLIENNNILDDQISSESNIEEILPSPTLLLQTSYTTFTYFTTMYIGKDSSKVKSRLETITNVVTETIKPKKEVEVEESNLPITYFTTFTYWTTLYKDKSTTITSREEIVSNVVSPSVQVAPTISPIDTTPIDIDSVLPPKDLEVEIKPSIVGDNLEQDDGKATFYTTYTYFTTFYAGDSSQIRSSLETVTNIVDNSKNPIDDNQIGRKVPSGPVGNDLIQDKGEKPGISPTVIKNEIKATQLPDLSQFSPSILSGTYIDNLYAEVKPLDKSSPQPEPEKKILFSQVAVISGNSTIVTNDNKTLLDQSTVKSISTKSSTEHSLISPNPDVIQSSVSEPEITTEFNDREEDDEDANNKKKSRLSFTSKKPSFTPAIRPFVSRNRPTFSPKRVPPLNSATTITRSDFTPTITATPTLKSVRSSGFGSNRKPSAFPGSSSSGRRFLGRSSVSSIASNAPAAPSRSSGFGRGNIQPSSRRSNFRSSSLRNNNDSGRSALPRIRPTASLRLRGGRQSASVGNNLNDNQYNESETSATQEEESVTEPLEEVTEATTRTTSNPLFRFRRPPLTRVPGTAVTPRSTTQSTPRKSSITRGRLTTTTRRTTTRTTTNPLLSLRRQRPNALFPKRNLFKKPESEPEKEVLENTEQEENQDESEEVLESEEFDEDNDYDSSDRKEEHVSVPTTSAPKRSTNVVQIRPFAFRKRSKRQVDYGNRKYSNFRRPATKPTVSRRTEAEPETEAPTTQRPRPSGRYSSRLSTNTRTTTSPPARTTARQPFIIRGDNRLTTSTSPSFRSRKSRPSSRSTTASSRPKPPRLSTYNSQTERSRNSQRTTSRSRGRTSTRGSSRPRTYNDNNSGERQNYNQLLNDGKITITHHIPTEVSIPVVNGKITEYKNILTAKPSIEILLANQVSTSLGPLGNQQLVLASELTELADNGATKIVKFVLHETPTTTIIFTPTTIRGRKTSYSHVVPSTVYNVEYVTSTISPEINANVPLANLLLSQLLLGNQQQQAINPLLALQGQGLIQPQPIVQTPFTEFKTRTTTYVTTVTDSRETVLPITFKGKAILTTIRDPVTNVITATEFITDTIVTTPTVLAPQNAQFNSLLLPLLLQQQQQPNLQTANPLLGLGQPDINLLQNNHLHNNDIYNNSPKPNILDITSNEDISEDPHDSEEDSPPPPPPSRPKNRPRPPKPAPPKLTSVVTLYVSGRIPGEFSTVLSTVVTDDTQSVRKREAIYYDDVKVLPSLLPSIDILASSQIDNILEDSKLDKHSENESVESQVETQSLESIVGELSKHIRYDPSPTYIVKLANPTSLRDSSHSSVDDGS